MKKRFGFLMAGTLAAAILAGVASAAEDRPSVDTIVAKANYMAYYQGKDGRAEVYMVIKDKQGRKRIRKFIILRKDVTPEGKGEDYCGEQRFYVYFKLPSDVRRMTFLVWKHLDRDDDRWLYLPALDLVKRIVSSEKRTSFVGSHFFYEDISGRNINDDVHEFYKETKDYYVIKNTPKKKEDVEFSYYLTWVHKKTFLPVKAEFFDKENRLYRVYEVLGVKKIQGHYTVTKARMKDDKMGGETIIEFKKVKYDVGLPDSVFTERYLRTPPRKYLR